eukprot:14315100-Alexandrium_andersonii.AAC.1
MPRPALPAARRELEQGCCCPDTGVAAPVLPPGGDSRPVLKKSFGDRARQRPLGLARVSQP